MNTTSKKAPKKSSGIFDNDEEFDILEMERIEKILKSQQKKQ